MCAVAVGVVLASLQQLHRDVVVKACAQQFVAQGCQQTFGCCGSAFVAHRELLDFWTWLLQGSSMHQQAWSWLPILREAISLHPASGSRHELWEVAPRVEGRLPFIEAVSFKELWYPSSGPLVGGVVPHQCFVRCSVGP